MGSVDILGVLRFIYDSGGPWLQASMPVGKNCAASTSVFGGFVCRHRCLLVTIVLKAHRFWEGPAGIGACW